MHVQKQFSGQVSAVVQASKFRESQSSSASVGQASTTNGGPTLQHTRLKRFAVNSWTFGGSSEVHVQGHACFDRNTDMSCQNILGVNQDQM